MHPSQALAVESARTFDNLLLEKESLHIESLMNCLNNVFNFSMSLVRPMQVLRLLIENNFNKLALQLLQRFDIVDSILKQEGAGVGFKDFLNLTVKLYTKTDGFELKFLVWI